MIFLQIINLLKFIFLEKKKKKFVFYSESIFYKNFYIDLVKNLKKKEDLVVVSSDINEFRNLNKKKFKSYYISNNLLKTIFFGTLNCDYLVMTMTDIGNNFPKSIFKCKYIYFFHSLASTHKIYTKNAFDQYNIIFVNGDYQIKEIRLNEKRKKLPNKILVKTGYFFLNFLKKKLNKKKYKKDTVLFAPSWTYDNSNLFNDYGLKIIQKLIDLKLNVILRPHPEIIKRFPDKILEIKKAFDKNKKFLLDNSSSNLISMEKSLLCLTDNSTITMEYALSLERQVIYLDYKDKIHNLSYKELNIETLESKFKKELGISIGIKDFLKSKSLLSPKNFSKTTFKKKLKKFEKKYLFNSSNSINKAVDFLKYLSEKNT